MPNLKPKRVEAELVHKLRRAGLRPTRQRVALGALLFRGDHRHVTPEILHQEAIGIGALVSLATVYNTLHQFTDAGLLCQERSGCRSFLFRYQHRASSTLLYRRRTPSDRHSRQRYPCCWSSLFTSRHEFRSRARRRAAKARNAALKHTSCTLRHGRTTDAARNGREDFCVDQADVRQLDGGMAAKTQKQRTAAITRASGGLLLGVWSREDQCTRVQLPVYLL